MKILMHDYGGYAFILSLSRELAERGHQVIHCYAASNNTPKGDMAPPTDASSGLLIEPVDKGLPLNKYSYWRRWRQERRYGRALGRAIRAHRPQVVISAQTPLDAQWPVIRAARAVGAGLAIWVHDLIGDATYRLLGPRWAGLGGLIGRYYTWTEFRQLRQSDHVIVISDLFVKRLATVGIAKTHLTVIPNWAALDELPRSEKDNPWSRRTGASEKFTFLYAGTLGLKHDASLLLDLAASLAADDREELIVISEGPGAEWLRARADEVGDRLRVLDYQPYRDLPQVLGAADVLVAILNEDAGAFSVPSKVLAYSCAGRPVLAAMPKRNPAAIDIQSTPFGLVVEPDDRAGFVQAAERLKADAGLRRKLGDAGRRYAEARFDIRHIADQFEVVIRAAAA